MDDVWVLAEALDGPTRPGQAHGLHRIFPRASGLLCSPVPDGRLSRRSLTSGVPQKDRGPAMGVRGDEILGCNADGCAGAIDELVRVRAVMASLGCPLYVGEGRYGWVCEKPQGAVLVLGPPRCGKTTCIIIPNVLAAYGPVVSTSTKEDVLHATVSTRQKLGRCWIFDPSGQAYDHDGVARLRWSPVDACHTWDDATAMAHLLVRTARMQAGREEGNFWNERAGNLLAPLLYAAAISGGGMRAVLRSVQHRDASDAIGVLASGGADAKLALAALSDAETANDRERSSTYSTVSTVLGAYASKAALDNTDDPNFQPELFPDGADTIYICAPSHVQQDVAPIVVGLIKVIQRATLARFAERERAIHRSGTRADHALHPPVVMALDELANIAPLWDLGSMIADAGSQGLSILACLQDMSQARERWDKAADGFFTVFGTKVLFPGIGDYRTLQLVSSLAGDKDVQVRSVTRQRGWELRKRKPASDTVSLRREPVLPIDAIAKGRPGMALVVANLEKPKWAHTTPWYSSEPWRTIVATS